MGLGVAAKAAFNVSSCLALMVVLGPRRLAPTVDEPLPPLPGVLGAPLLASGLGQLLSSFMSGGFIPRSPLLQLESTDPGETSRSARSSLMD